jgi:hypothetical protein
LRWEGGGTTPGWIRNGWAVGTGVYSAVAEASQDRHDQEKMATKQMQQQQNFTLGSSPLATDISELETSEVRGFVMHSTMEAMRNMLT